MTNSPLGIKAWKKDSGSYSLSIVEPSNKVGWTEGRFLTKEDMVQMSLHVAAEIYMKQSAEAAKVVVEEEKQAEK